MSEREKLAQLEKQGVNIEAMKQMGLLNREQVKAWTEANKVKAEAQKPQFHKVTSGLEETGIVMSDGKMQRVNPESLPEYQAPQPAPNPQDMEEAEMVANMPLPEREEYFKKHPDRMQIIVKIWEMFE